MARRVRLGVDPAAGEERFDLRRRPERPPVVGDVERLDAVGVAREEESAALRVPEREGEHPAQLVEHVLATLGPEVEENLRVGVRAEAVARLLEPVADRLVVVDLAVERDHVRAGVPAGHHRLGAVGREVDDGEPAVPQPGASVGGKPRALAVRAAPAIMWSHVRPIAARSTPDPSL